MGTRILGMTRDFIFRNTFADIEYAIKELPSHGTRFEFECYDLGHLYNLSVDDGSGWIEGQFSSKWPWHSGRLARIDNLMHAHNREQTVWHGLRMVSPGRGRHQMPYHTKRAFG